MEVRQEQTEIRDLPSSTARHISFGVLFAFLATFSAFGLAAFAHFGPCPGLKDSHISTRIGALTASGLFFAGNFFSIRSFWRVEKQKKLWGILLSVPFLLWALLVSVYVVLIGVMGAILGG